MLRLDFNLVLEMINLVVLFLLLRKFLIGPITNIMEKRKALIAEGLDNANKQQEQAAALKSQYEEALSGAKQESQEMIAKAKQDARIEYDRIVGDADTQAGKIIQTARETVEAEKDQTLREMKSEVAGLAMDAARKLVAEQCGEDQSRAAYDQFLKEAGDLHDSDEN